MSCHYAKRMLLPAVFVAACAITLGTFFLPQRTLLTRSVRRTKAAPDLILRWRTPMAAVANRPCAFSGGWIVSDRKGGVTALSTTGKVLWQNAFSNQLFDAGAVVVSNLAIVASQDGQVFALRVDGGATAWTYITPYRFQQVPLIGNIGAEPVLWLVSQADGQLICLRCRDGLLIWQGDATNRCDGEPTVWQGRVAYGNCDGAVYVFDVANGHLKGSVSVGDEDQMAGGVLAMADGRLVVGTRRGNLAVVHAEQLTLDAVISVSQGEMFVTPVQISNDVFAAGTPEGDVVFCRIGHGTLKVIGRVALGAAVDQLVTSRGVLYALSGGSVCMLADAESPVVRVSLGDDVRGLSVGENGILTCVADQAVVCIAGGTQ